MNDEAPCEMPKDVDADLLSRPLELLWTRPEAERTFDVVIVGSGYGGSVAADALGGCKLGGKDVRVCLFERGREYPVGAFPAGVDELPGHIRVGHQNSGIVQGSEQGLFDVRLGDHVAALVANGLGGGSLINAGVLLEPDAREARRPVWKETLEDLRANRYFDAAMKSLGGQVEDAVTQVVQWCDNTIDRHPAVSTQRSLKKTAALESLAAAAGQLAGTSARMSRPRLATSMRNHINASGVPVKECMLCGDCMTGCNVGAKNSLDQNLLAQAAGSGVCIYTGASVLSLRRSRPHRGEPTGMWALRVAYTDRRQQGRELDEQFIFAGKVVLAAGTLGTPEILLRSRTDQLMFSGMLGSGFSCNGDNLSAVHRMSREVHGAADDDMPYASRGIGPTITGMVELRSSGKRPFLWQEFAVPAPLKRLFDETVTTSSLLNGLQDGDRSSHGSETAGSLDPLAVDSEAMERTLLVGTIGHDGASGTLVLSNPVRPREGPPQQGAIRIDWPDARHGRELDDSHEVLQAAADRLEGTPPLLPNPVWRFLPDKVADLIEQPRGPVLTVHPLGGCGVGKDPSEGVVDPFGNVFNGAFADGKGDWFGTLLVLDGSVIPESLGVNPALTISAFAMRAIAQWRSGLHVLSPGQRVAKLRPQNAVPYEPPPRIEPTQVGIVERLSGTVELALGGKPKECVVELTMAYVPVDLRHLMSTLRRQVELKDADPSSGENANCLRIYDKTVWESEGLRFASQGDRDRHRLFDAELGGSLRLLHREASSYPQRVFRVFLPWLLNRGARDVYRGLCGDRTEPPGPHRRVDVSGRVRDYLRAASRAGEVRLFEYDLVVGKIVFATAGAGGVIGPGAVIRGTKRLTYTRRGNPWKQLGRMTLDAMPAWTGRSAELALDLRFLVGEGIPLLRIVEQRNSARALVDLCSLGLYLLRVVVSVHLWSFRKPDALPARGPQRLPGEVPGLPSPQVTELIVDRDSASGTPVVIRLTRYPNPGRQPLVMIHGYSVGGNTFTHPSIQPNAAQYFHGAGGGGHDVWVLDMRTSSGMPTATIGWSFEQAALIDIPAALLHVRNQTGMRVDVLAHCIGCAMLSMALLTEASSVRSGDTQLGVSSWLTSEHLGTLAAFNGPPSGGRGHPCIRRVVLSQKGPFIRYTDGNVLRAFLMQTARRWLFPEGFQFRPSERPGVGEGLMDRLLSTLPYPDADYDTENPWWPPCRYTPWTGTRHRMDALYGVDFSAANLRPETLEAIDDLFGPISIESVAQTIHFARFQGITNQRGRGEFVTLGRLAARWRGIPTLQVHGRDNGLADFSTQDLIRRYFEASGVDFSHEAIPETGHQDCMIGMQAADVFGRINRFLQEERTSPKEAQLQALVVNVPWIGPRISFDAAQGLPGAVVAAMSDPRLGTGALLLLPASASGSARCLSDIRVEHWNDCVAIGEKGSSAGWLRTPAPDGAMAVHAAKLPGPRVAGWLALCLYQSGETVALRSLPVASNTIQPPEEKGQGKSRLGGPKDYIIPDAGWYHDVLKPLAIRLPFLTNVLPSSAAGLVIETVEPWVKAQSDRVLEKVFVRLADVVRVRRVHTKQAVRGKLRFAVGSCQYPYGLLDRIPAARSLTRLARRACTMDFALLVGDQIYADGTAGLVDPVRPDELYEAPHDRALRVPAMRDLMRRVQVRTLPDDHEIQDNWEPLPPTFRTRRAAEFLRRERARDRGLGAFFRFQRMVAGPPRSNLPDADEAFLARGYPFYLLDTRTRRSARGGEVAPANVDILSPPQWETFETWLQEHADEVKFVATPSVLLPRHTAASGHSGATSDGWEGYPRSLVRLLCFLFEHDIRHTVFLSGDEHHSFLSQTWLKLPGASADRSRTPAHFVSVHASGLNAPFPFANGRPRDLLANETIRLGGFEATVRTVAAPPGDGFAQLSMEADHTGPVLKVSFSVAGMAPRVHRVPV